MPIDMFYDKQLQIVAKEHNSFRWDFETHKPVADSESFVVAKKNLYYI